MKRVPKEEGWALTRNQASGCYHNPNLSELIAAVDAFEGEPTAADIARLADRYGDLRSMVRHLFETRADRRQAPHIARRASGWPQFRWLPQEDTLAMRDDLSLRQIAARLNALPINQERGAVRTEMAVSRRRAVLRQRPPPG